MEDVFNYVVEKILSPYRISGRDYFLEFYNNQYNKNYKAEDLNNTSIGDFKQGTQKFDMYNAFQHAFSSGMLTLEKNSNLSTQGVTKKSKGDF